MAVAVRLWLLWCVIFVFALAVLGCSARHTLSFSSSENVVEMEMHGRSLRAMTDDYNDPTANRGHDPRNRGGIGGRKSRDNP